MLTPPAVPDFRTVDPLAILFCADPPFFQHVAAALASVAVSNPGGAIDVHLLTSDRSPQGEARLGATAARFPGIRLTVHHLDAGRTAGWHVDRHLSKECYLRIVAPEILPAELGRILYLDSDVIVVDDLRPLWCTDMGGRPVGAVPDILTQPPRACLGIAGDHVYVNSGVLLLDLRVWRARGLTAALTAFIERQGSSLEYHDQDAINALLQNDIHILDFRWNLQTQHLRFGRRVLGNRFPAIRRAARDPAILHYSGAAKPWKFRARTARKRDYHRHLALTAWSGTRPPLDGVGERLEYALDRALARAGIDYLHLLHILGRLPGRLREEAAARLGRERRSSGPARQGPQP